MRLSSSVALSTGLALVPEASMARSSAKTRVWMPCLRNSVIQGSSKHAKVSMLMAQPCGMEAGL